MNVFKAVAEHCTSTLTTPFYYAGQVDKTVNKGMNWWREFFFPMSRDLVHDQKRIVWHEISERHGLVLPTTVCNCEEGDYVSMYNNYTEKSLSHAHLALHTAVDCDYNQFLRPGENPYSSRNFKDDLNEYFLGLQDKVFESYDAQEELWAAQMMTEGKVVFEPKGGKPYEVHFARKDELNHTLEDPTCYWCQDEKGKKYTHEPWRDIRMMDKRLWDCNKGRTDTIVMNWQTCEWFMNAYRGMAKDGCCDLGMFQLILPNSNQFASLVPTQPFDGVEAVGVLRGRVNAVIYCVQAEQVFCHPETGADVCLNILEDGKVYGYNRNGTQRNTLNGRFIYGRIDNHHNDQDRIKRFFHTYVTESGDAIKMLSRSTPMLALECADASWCLDVCGGTGGK